MFFVGRNRKNEEHSFDFNFKISEPFLQNFLLAEIERMQADCTSLVQLLKDPCFLENDIFSKYLEGKGVNHLPFKLIRSDNESKVGKKRSGMRGPYRKYSDLEKAEIIQRMLSGQSLKKIAEKTMIPKRNLIRWKHEFLFHQKHVTEGDVDAIQEEWGDLDEQLLEIKKDVMETREILTTESMDLIKLQ